MSVVAALPGVSISVRLRGLASRPWHADLKRCVLSEGDLILEDEAAALGDGAEAL